MLPDEGYDGPELREYLRILRRRKVPLLLSILVVVGAGLAVSFAQTPIYAATAQVLLGQRASENLFATSPGQISPQRALENQTRVMRSDPVRESVRERLGFWADVRARSAGQTDIIVVTAEDPDPRRAAEIANAYATTYVEYRRKQSIDDVLAAASEIQTRIDGLQRQIDTAVSPLKENLIQQQATFRGKLEQLEVSATLQSGGAEVVDRATVPASPIRPTPIRTGVIALMLGVALGLGVAFLIEYLDDSVKSEEDLAKAAHPLPVIATIPRVPGWKARAKPRVISIEDSTSAASEAYRSLRTSLQFMSVDQPIRSLQATSAGPREGKTTTIANLGVALARAGQRVVIVCCDLRRPRIHEFFGLTNSVGFTSVLLGDSTLGDALQRVPGVDRLYLLASGPLPPNPSELLQSRRAAEILKHLQADDAFLMVDTPPILPVADAMILAKQVQATLLVCSAGSTTRKQVTRSVELLRTVEAPLVGTVLNGVKRQSHYGDGYYYYSSYRSKAPAGTANGNGAGRPARAGRGIRR